MTIETTETPPLTIGASYAGLLSGGTITDPFVLLEGKRGTAKTRSILTAMTERGLKYPGYRGLLCRSTRVRLSETVLLTLASQVLPAFGLAVPKGNPENWHRIELGNGSEFIPMGLDDPNRSQSKEVTDIYVSEGVEIPLIDTITSLAGAMRHDCGAPFHQCFVDCNPGAPSHPLNKIAEDVPNSLRMVEDAVGYERLVRHNLMPCNKMGRWKRIVTSHYDNPGYFDAAAWRWLPLGLKYLATLQNLTGHFRSRWLHGLWVAAEGSVFPEFCDANIIDPFEVPATWPMWCLIDPGYDHPCAVTWGTVSPNGCRYTVDEVYERQNSIAEIAAKMLARGWIVNATYLDPRHGFSRTQQSPVKIAEQFQKCGIRCQPWPRAQGSEIDASVAGHRRAIIEKKYKVFRNCLNVIDEHQSWSYKRTAAGEVPVGDDQYEDKKNHALDGIMGWERTGPTFRPAQVSVKEPARRGAEVEPDEYVKAGPRGLVQYPG